MKSDYLISALVIVRNDELVLKEFARELSTVLAKNYAYYEILFVDMYSDDRTLAILRELTAETPNMRFIRLSSEANLEIGLTAALEHCIGDHAVVLNPYFDDPAYIPRLVDEACNGNEVVTTKRRTATNDRFGRSIFYRVASYLLKRRLDPSETDFRLFSRKAISSLTKIKHRRRNYRYFTELMGFNKATIVVEPHPRAAQSPRRPGFLHDLRRSLDLLISNSSTPLRIVAGLGLFASFMNLVFLLYVLVVALVKDRVAEGWLTTSVVMSSMFFGLFFILAVLAEYIARILAETQERPLYFIQFEEHSTRSSAPEHTQLNVVVDEP